MLVVTPFNKVSVSRSNGKINLIGHNVVTIENDSFKPGEEYTHPCKIVELEPEVAIDLAQKILDECGRLDG